MKVRSLCFFFSGRTRLYRGMWVEVLVLVLLSVLQLPGSNEEIPTHPDDPSCEIGVENWRLLFKLWQGNVALRSCMRLPLIL